MFPLEQNFKGQSYEDNADSGTISKDEMDSNDCISPQLSAQMCDLSPSISFISSKSPVGFSFSPASDSTDRESLVVSQAKVEKLKRLMAEAEEVHNRYKETKMLIHLCKTTAKKLPVDLKKKIDQIITGSSVQKNSKLVDKTGKSFNLLGLGDYYMEELKTTTLSQLEKQTLNQSLKDTVAKTVKEIRCKKQHLKGAFKDSPLKDEVETSSSSVSLLPNIRQDYFQTLQLLQGNINQMLEQMVQNQQLTQQLVDMRAVNDTKQSQIDSARVALLHQKAQLLATGTGNVKLCGDQKMYGNDSFNTTLNEQGARLNSSISKKEAKLSKLQESLKNYKAKEDSSEEFKKIVAEYNQTVINLQTKKTTLEILSSNSTSSPDN